MDIERQSAKIPVSEEQIVKWLRARNCIGMVAERDHRVVGYMIYDLHKTHFKLVRFAVHPSFRKIGVGSAMIRKLKSKMSATRRQFIGVTVPEDRLEIQQFFRRHGFLAGRVVDGDYDGCHTGYRMKCWVDGVG
jgi:ribosomal-protein-alanine N-acetyltransferase